MGIKNIEGKKADRMILALLQEPSLEKAAAAVGVTEVTVWRWLRTPAFREKYLAARRDAFSRSLAKLQHASVAAVATLVRIMIDKDAPAASRVRAADCVLTHAASAFELEDIELRLTLLETRQEGVNAN